MKIKLKDGWEMDCLILRKNGEKVTFQYDSINDKLVKIVEVKEEELKELFDIKKTLPISKGEPMEDSFNKPSIKPLKLRNKPKDVSINSRKLTLETIKKIKIMAEQGKDNLAIAEYFHISPQLVNYWRKNTPKEL